MSVAADTILDDFLCAVLLAEADLEPGRYHQLLTDLNDEIWKVLEATYARQRRQERQRHKQQLRNLDTPALATTVAKTVLNGTSDEHRQAVEAVLGTLDAVAEIRWRRGALRELGIDPDEFVTKS